MSQLYCDIPDELARKLEEKAKRVKMPVSKYLAKLIERDVEEQWPKDYFDCFGGWQGDPLERPKQGEYEQRTSFD